MRMESVEFEGFRKMARNFQSTSSIAQMGQRVGEIKDAKILIGGQIYQQEKRTGPQPEEESSIVP